MKIYAPFGSACLPYWLVPFNGPYQYWQETWEMCVTRTENKSFTNEPSQYKTGAESNGMLLLWRTWCTICLACYYCGAHDALFVWHVTIVVHMMHYLFWHVTIVVHMMHYLIGMSLLWCTWCTICLACHYCGAHDALFVAAQVSHYSASDYW